MQEYQSISATSEGEVLIHESVRASWRCVRQRGGREVLMHEYKTGGTR